MTKVSMAIEHEGKTYNASVQTIEKVNVTLGRDYFITINIDVKNCSLGGFCLGSIDKTSKDMGAGTSYLYDWVYAVFKLTGAESFEKAKGKPVMCIWQRDGGLGDRIVGMATIDGSFVFIPGDKE